ncbi:MAG: ankyrin repeat domain-containing protein [Xanthomonadaceae bacterium]|jgi:ankyrin repeat protein|nr:ankyrin repeat domain-containing protein [Xanthomonadaceae bacterium]
MALTRALRQQSWPIAGLLAVLLLAGCLQAGPQASRLGAQRYFEGKALALAVATENGDIRRINRLMQEEGVDPDTVFSTEGVPLLAWPLRAERLDSLRAMLENGADPNAHRVDEFTSPLSGKTESRSRNNAMVFAAAMEDSRYLELLLDYGGDPNTRNVSNETLLFQALISQNQWQNIQLLIKRGADINAHAYGLVNTPITWYSTRGAFDRVWWLLQHGADPTVRSRMPEDPPDQGRMVAVEHIYWRPTLPEQIPWQRQCQQWLIDRGISRPPMTEALRKDRQHAHLPYENEDQIPLLAELPATAATPVTDGR